MKRIVKAVSALLILTASVTSAGGLSFIHGDVNEDGAVNNKDVMSLFRAVSSGEVIPGGRGDVNVDGAVNNKDVTALFKYVSGGDLPGVVYADTFTVSRAFGDGMVIQRNEPVRIWGWAPSSENGKIIRAEFAGLYGTSRIVNGEWMITLNGTLGENTSGQTLTVSGSGFEKRFEDVLVGDVYWVVGQSNIDYSVSVIKNEPLASAAGRNIRISNDMKIRLNRSYFGTDYAGLTQGTNDVNKDAVQPRGWEYPEQGALDFSAIGYFTAYQMYEKLGGTVPFGLIEFDGNGCALHAFMPNEVRDTLGISTCNNGVYSAAGVNMHPSSFMYNHYMYAFQNMPISGIIWYQGESDCQIANNNCFLYADRFAALMTYYREKHNCINHDYPVYIVEFPPIYMNFDYAQVRMNMGMIPTKLNNAHICTSSDLWKDKTYANNLHPYNKWEISSRMSDIILANAYGIGNIEDTEGPRAVSCTFSDGGRTATVRFTNVGGGLEYTGTKLSGIKVITKDVWVDPLSVRIISSDTIEIKTLTKMLWAGYNTAPGDSFPETLSLCSGTGVPSSAWQFSNLG